MGSPRLLSVGVTLRILFTGARPRAAQHVGNRPRLLLVGETQRICGLRSCDQEMTAGRAKLEENPPAKSKNKDSVSGKTWFTVLNQKQITAAPRTRRAVQPPWTQWRPKSRHWLMIIKTTIRRTASTTRPPLPPSTAFGVASHSNSMCGAAC